MIIWIDCYLGMKGRRACRMGGRACGGGWGMQVQIRCLLEGEGGCVIDVCGAMLQHGDLTFEKYCQVGLLWNLRSDFRSGEMLRRFF